MEGLVIIPTQESSCCSNEFMGSTLFMTPKHMVTAGLLSASHQTLSWGEQAWSVVHLCMALGPVPAVRVSLGRGEGGHSRVLSVYHLLWALPSPGPGKVPHLGCVESSPQDVGHTPTVDRCGDKQKQRHSYLFISILSRPSRCGGDGGDGSWKPQIPSRHLRFRPVVAFCGGMCCTTLVPPKITWSRESACRSSTRSGLRSSMGSWGEGEDSETDGPSHLSVLHPVSGELDPGSGEACLLLVGLPAQVSASHQG